MDNIKSADDFADPVVGYWLIGRRYRRSQPR
jgi:hypothetical protein